MKNSFEANINIVLEAHFGSASQTEEYQLNIIFILEEFSSELYLKKTKKTTTVQLIVITITTNLWIVVRECKNIEGRMITPSVFTLVQIYAVSHNLKIIVIILVSDQM